MDTTAQPAANETNTTVPANDTVPQNNHTTLEGAAGQPVLPTTAATADAAKLANEKQSANANDNKELTETVSSTEVTAVKEPSKRKSKATPKIKKDKVKVAVAKTARVQAAKKSAQDGDSTQEKVVTRGAAKDKAASVPPEADSFVGPRREQLGRDLDSANADRNDTQMQQEDHQEGASDSVQRERPAGSIRKILTMKELVQKAIAKDQQRKGSKFDQYKERAGSLSSV